MAVFQLGNFKLHSGEWSPWKIECDELIVDDWNTLAYLGSKILPTEFKEVVGIPEGGLLFAEAMKKYISPRARNVLIVDDVWTTGKSMYTKYYDYSDGYVTGLVAFCRAPRTLPIWCTTIWALNTA